MEAPGLSSKRESFDVLTGGFFHFSRRSKNKSLPRLRGLREADAGDEVDYAIELFAQCQKEYERLFGIPSEPLHISWTTFASEQVICVEEPDVRKVFYSSKIELIKVENITGEKA